MPYLDDKNAFERIEKRLSMEDAITIAKEYAYRMCLFQMEVCAKTFLQNNDGFIEENGMWHKILNSPVATEVQE